MIRNGIVQLVFTLIIFTQEASAQDARFDCPPTSCWCHDTCKTDEIHITSDVHYRTAFNSYTKKNQTLFLDEYNPPASSKSLLRPGAVIVHGGGFSTGPHNGCSHGKDMASFANIAKSFARHGFVAVSIDYRCEGPLRPTDLYSVWHDPVEDVRAAVKYMVTNAGRLQLDPSRIVAFGGSAGAITVAQLLYTPLESTQSEVGGNVTCSIGLSGALVVESIDKAQINPGSTSPAYIDFHGTNDTTVPYSNDTRKQNHTYIWDDAIDTKAWLDKRKAPNYLCSIPGEGHVPFNTLYVPPYNTTFFGFLLKEMDLSDLSCPH